VDEKKEQKIVASSVVVKYFKKIVSGTYTRSIRYGFLISTPECTMNSQYFIENKKRKENPS